MSETIFLRFPDREAARAAFALYGSGTVEGPDGTTVWPSCGTYEGHRYDIVVVGADGKILRPTGATIEDDSGFGPQPVLEPVAGFHVNVLWHGPGDLIPDFGAARVFPATPEGEFAAA